MKDNLSIIKSKLEEYTNEITRPSKTAGTDMYICPCCGSGTPIADGKRHDGAFHLYGQGKTKWKCHACGRGGTIIDLYGYINGINANDDDGFKKIIQALEEKYNLSSNFSFSRVSAEEDFKGVPLPEESHADGEQEDKAYKEYEEKEIAKTIEDARASVGKSDYLTKRGISLEVQQRFQIGFIDNYIHPKTKYNNANNPYLDTWGTPRIVITTSDSSYLARATTPEPPQDDPRHKYYVKYYKCGETYLFNSGALCNHENYCFVFEGEIDALSGIECGFNATGLGSTSMIPKLFNYHIDKEMVLIIAMDNDAAGDEATKKLIELCKKHKQPYTLAYSDMIFNGAKDCNEALQKDRKALIEQLEYYKKRALEFDKEDFFKSLEAETVSNEKEKVSSMPDVVAHQDGTGENSTIEENPTPPEITPDNITSKEVLSYMLNLNTEIDILNYIQLLKDKAREYKKLKDVETLCSAYKKEALKHLSELERAEKTPEQAHDWVYLDEKNKIKIDEDRYCIYKSNQLGIRTIKGRILTTNGELEEDMLENLVYTDIKRYINQDLAPRTKKLVSAIKIQSYSPEITPDGNIHLANGVYNVSSRNFENKKLWCVNRLAVAYNMNAPRPTKWIAFLNDLLETDDIITLQEYLGYCLIPSTKAQKMLLIVGAGGEGKSVIGDVITALLGEDNISADKLHQLQENRFKIANCENKLLFLDDDLKFKALEDTGEIKTIVTGGRTTIERKGSQGYDVKLYSRILCFGNGSISSLYDHSDGFYRRQIIIKTKPKKTNRVDNPYLSDDIITAELEGVLLWCLEGLHRLLDHNYKIHISKASKEALEESKSSVLNVVEWIKQADEVQFNANYEATSVDICRNYQNWCYNNALTPLKDRTVITYLKDHANELGIKFDFNITKKGKRARGFRGIRLMQSYEFGLQHI